MGGRSLNTITERERGKIHDRDFSRARQDFFVTELLKLQHSIFFVHSHFLLTMGHSHCLQTSRKDSAPIVTDKA